MFRLTAGVRLRALLLLAALVVPGCLSEPEPSGRLAQPTDKPVRAPVPTVPPPPPPDFNDPGYVMDVGWAVGDAWDYYGNRSSFRAIRVVDEATYNGTRWLIVDQVSGSFEHGTRIRLRSWVDTETWTAPNATYVGGYRVYKYSPGTVGDRYLRNGTFSYNETTLEHGIVTDSAIVRANSYYAGTETYRLPWGTATVGRVEHRVVHSAIGGDVTRWLAVKLVARDYANDVYFTAPDGEAFSLQAVKLGPNQRGDLLIV